MSSPGLPTPDSTPDSTADSSPGTAGEITDADIDALAERYYGTIGAVGYADPLPLDPADTVLVVVDAQQHIAKPAIRASLTAAGLYEPGVEPVLDAIEARTRAAAANIGEVLAACRAIGIRAVHVGIQALLPGAEDTGALHRAGGMLYPPGSAASEFLPEAAPATGEIVLTKTCSGIHVGTRIDQVLRNLGADKVVMAGFYTDQCISASVRDLADIGYRVSLIEDAMGAMSPQRHRNALESIRKLYANSETTAEFVARAGALAERSRGRRGGWLTGRHRR
ncbi:isochorismatase [Leucobacter massiliensis]|uniref:Isochorismatase n=2 Tax=Leucobacter massiliensis TaxID=1686285 RepID=A0A2S9QP38_9MICO|nr:isochorismatase [Leucobacter massiliensis]